MLSVAGHNYILAPLHKILGVIDKGFSSQLMELGRFGVQLKSIKILTFVTKIEIRNISLSILKE